MSYPPDYWTRDIAEHWFGSMLRPDQLAAFCYTLGWPFWGEDTAPRDPGLVVSVGCGTGVLEDALEVRGHKVVGVDPHIPKNDYQGSTLRRRWDDWKPGTVIFCQSLEHIANPWPILDSITCRIVITNWVDRHPIPLDPSGWDHVFAIDDAVFDRISVGREVILRRGSHLVVE